MFADLLQVGFIGSHLGGTAWFKQRSHLFVQVAGQYLKLLLPQAAFRFQALPFTRLGQSITARSEQFGRTAEEATVGENLLERGVGFVHAAILHFPSAEVALLDFVLGQHQLLPKRCLLQ